MKTVKSVYECMCSPEVIRLAIDNAAIGKHRYKEVKLVLKNIDYYVKDLRNKLLTDTFVPSPYKIDIRKTEYGKVREIFKLPFYPDRVVQHCIAIVMKKRWEKALTVDTYACLKGRGINCRNPKYNICKKVKRALCTDYNNTYYCLKMDIKHCYPSVDNDIMSKLNRKYCKDKRLLHLIDIITFNCQGLPIGNYLSLLQINIYLAPLDRFIKETLKVKYYFRYMDDIVIFGSDKKELHLILWRIMNFVYYNLNMQFNSKRQIFKIGTNRKERGLDFVGYVFYRHYTLIRKRVKVNMWKKRNCPKSMASYLGIARSCNSTHLMNKILGNVHNSTIKMYKVVNPITIIDKTIIIKDFELLLSRNNPRNIYMILRFYNTETMCYERILSENYKRLIDILKDIDKNILPKQTIIKYRLTYYFNNNLIY